MPLLDRYLTAVKFWLPRTQREDIASELGANLQAEIDDRAAALDRSLTDAEIAEILKHHGPPVLVASRYRQEKRTVNFGRQLIGPVLFPFYLTALKFTVFLLLVPGIISRIVLGGHWPIFAGVGSGLMWVARVSLPLLLLVTLVFALIDFCLRRFHIIEKWSNAWDPNGLPPATRQAKQVRRSSSITGIILQSIFVVWWWNHGSIPLLTITNAGAQVHFAPVLTTLYWPILIVGFISLAQHWVNLVEPDWRWLPPATQVVTSLICLIVLYPLLHSFPLISILDSNGIALAKQEAAQIQKIIWIGVMSVWVGVLIAGAVSAWRLVWLAWHGIQRTPMASPRNGTAQI